MSKFKESYIELLLQTKREGIEDLIEFLGTTDLYIAAASTEYIRPYEGGLVEHCLMTTQVALEIYKKFNKDFKEVNESSIVLCGLLHDIYKCGMYEKSVRNVKEDGVWVQKDYISFNRDFVNLGHTMKSVMLAQHAIQLSYPEISAIWLMAHGDNENPDIQKTVYNVRRHNRLALLMETAHLWECNQISLA